MNTTFPWLPALLVAFAGFVSRTSAADGQGGQLFPNHVDIGSPTMAGSAKYEPANSAYVISGGGDNMWSTNDSFQYAWKQMTGDLTLASDIIWSGTNGNAHRKACLIIRQTLEPDAAYVDVAVHGNGLTSLQFREAKGANTLEIQGNVSAPRRVRIEKHGEFVSMSAAGADGAVLPTGASYMMRFQEPFYVGLGVCAHDANAIEKATFSHIELTALAPLDKVPARVQCALEVIPIGSKDRRVVYQATNHIEAPNWSRDGKFFVFNQGGKLYKLPVAGGTPEMLETGFARRINNDHGFSPDGRMLAISDSTEDGKSIVYVLPATGGAPKRITSQGPSYWHGWSPDGRMLAFCGERKGEFDIYLAPAEGGEEMRLTTAAGLDDGPDYSPDGKFIYFNSERSGSMQIWRMNSDGSGQEQVTADEYNNWFAHPSPDGKWIVFLSYTKEVKGHPENQRVMLRMMPAGGGAIQTLAKLFGGQGTINVPSWSPDSKSVAFVSYEPVF